MLPSNSSKRTRLCDEDTQDFHHLQPQQQFPLSSFSTLPSERPRTPPISQQPSQKQQRQRQLFTNNLQSDIQRQLIYQQQNQTIGDLNSQQQTPSPPQLFASPSNDNEQTTNSLSQDEYKKLEKVIDALIETVVPTKVQQAKEAAKNIINSSLSRKISEENVKNGDNNASGTNNNTNNTNAVTLDFPIIAEPVEETEPLVSPLSAVLNHTFPKSLVELVDKLNKMSINPANLDLLNPQNVANTTPTTTPSLSSTSPPPPSSSSNIPPPPSKELIKSLIKDYFDRFNILIPILDRQKFRDKYKDGSKTSELLLNSVLALSAARFSDDPAIQKSLDKPSGIFFDAAKVFNNFT